MLSASSDSVLRYDPSVTIAVDSVRSDRLSARDVTAVPAVPVMRFRVDQYHAMIGAGILADGDPVELLDGWLVYKMSKDPAHRLTTGLLRDLLERVLGAGYHVDSQEPITTDDSEPEPDVVVVRGSRRDYEDRHPGPRDVALVVEVADATLERDRSLKRRLYARAGVELYWLVSLPDRRLEVYSRREAGADDVDYGDRRDYGPDEAVPVMIDGTELARITVAEFLPVGSRASD